jgi:hypothetical protein
LGELGLWAAGKKEGRGGEGEGGEWQDGRRVGYYECMDVDSVRLEGDGANVIEVLDKDGSFQQVSLFSLRKRRGM